MNSLYKFFSVATFALIAASLAATGALVISAALGVAGGAWLLWYFSMYSTFATILMAVITTIVFVAGYYKETDKATYGKSRVAHPQTRMIYG